MVGSVGSLEVSEGQGESGKRIVVSFELPPLVSSEPFVGNRDRVCATVKLPTIFIDHKSRPTATTVVESKVLGQRYESRSRRRAGQVRVEPSVSCPVTRGLVPGVSTYC